MSEVAIFTPPHPLNTAVLFLVFNRLDTTKQVFEAIRKAQPPRLYIAADGARANKEGEADKVKAVRDHILSSIDWDCEIKTLFRKENLGCKYAVSGALNWFFENEEMGIILEDDCLPDPSFFRFCQELLERYKDDQRIGMISGDNLQLGHRRNDDSYYFSKYVHIWGWATWRDKWQSSYDAELTKWPAIRDGDWLEDMLGNKKEVSSWMSIFEKMYNGEIDTWDYQWVFANWVEGRINIMPNVNLISNIGFGADATHTVNSSPLANLPSEKILFPITHPIGVFRNLQADLFTFDQHVNVSIFKRILSKVLSYIK